MKRCLALLLCFVFVAEVIDPSTEFVRAGPPGHRGLVYQGGRARVHRGAREGRSIVRSFAVHRAIAPEEPFTPVLGVTRLPLPGRPAIHSDPFARAIERPPSFLPAFV